MVTTNKIKSDGMRTTATRAPTTETKLNLLHNYITIDCDREGFVLGKAYTMLVKLIIIYDILKCLICKLSENKFTNSNRTPHSTNNIVTPYKFNAM